MFKEDKDVKKSIAAPILMFSVQYYYESQGTFGKKYNTNIPAYSEDEARSIFYKINPGAVIKWMEEIKTK